VHELHRLPNDDTVVHLAFAPPLDEDTQFATVGVHGKYAADVRVVQRIRDPGWNFLGRSQDDIAIGIQNERSAGVGGYCGELLTVFAINVLTIVAGDGRNRLRDRQHPTVDGSTQSPMDDEYRTYGDRDVAEGERNGERHG
jgi:hypothetical protein